MNYLDFVLIVDKNKVPCIPIKESTAAYLLRHNKAKIINHDPTVIQRFDEYSADYEIRNIFELKIDSGYLNIGFSVSDSEHEYLAGQVNLLQGMSERLTVRASNRRFKRARLRYRKNKNVDYKIVHNPTYKNGNQDGWIAPSIQHKIDSHIRLIKKIAQWVPIDRIIIEVAKFDIQKMIADLDGRIISGKDYQNGEMKGYENVTAYVRDRDKYTCQMCLSSGKVKNKNNDTIEVHHIIPRAAGGTNRPSNLICLCHHHHRLVHSNNNNNKYFKELQNKKMPDTYKDSTFMNIVRYKIYNALCADFKDVELAYGYETKINRRLIGLPKFHYTDAVCLKEWKNISLTKFIYIVDQKRCNDRKMESFFDAKYIDIRDGKTKSGTELCYTRLDNASSWRTTCKNEVDNLRQYREKKITKGRKQRECHFYCLKPGDLIFINLGNHKGNLAEVKTMQIQKGKYKIFFIYKNQKVDNPTISLSPEEYEQLKKNECSKVKIVRTRRGMIWRKYNRLEYENTYKDQYDKN
jgi:hypothetical protein